MIIYPTDQSVSLFVSGIAFLAGVVKDMAELSSKEQKRLHIIRTAMALFAQNGIHKTKVSEIAKMAGIGKGTVYEYFRSKDGIFWNAVSQWLHEFDRVITERMSGTDDPEEQLALLIRTVFDFYQSTFEGLNITLESWLEMARLHHQLKSGKGELPEGIPDLKCHFKEYRQRVKDLLTAGIEQGKFRPMNVELTAALIFAMFDGFELHYITQRSDFEDVTQVSTVFVQMILDGIRA